MARHNKSQRGPRRPESIRERNRARKIRRQSRRSQPPQSMQGLSDWIGAPPGDIGAAAQDLTTVYPASGNHSKSTTVDRPVVKVEPPEVAPAAPVPAPTKPAQAPRKQSTKTVGKWQTARKPIFRKGLRDRKLQAQQRLISAKKNFQQLAEGMELTYHAYQPDDMPGIPKWRVKSIGGAARPSAGLEQCEHPGSLYCRISRGIKDSGVAPSPPPKHTPTKPPTWSSP